MSKKSKAVKVLNYVETHGAVGLTFTQIQRYAFSLTRPSEPFTRENRGWWCTNLRVLLSAFTVKVNGRYVRNNRPHKGRPYSVARQRINSICALLFTSDHDQAEATVDADIRPLA